MESEEPEKKRSLEEIFGVAPSEPTPDVPVVEGVVEADVEQVQDEVDQDFSEARDNLKDIAAMASDALRELADIAKQSEQPRSYDALSKMISAGVIANKALVEIHKNRKEGKNDDGSPSGPSVVNNNLYMTTAEFQKRLEQLNGEEEEG